MKDNGYKEVNLDELDYEPINLDSEKNEEVDLETLDFEPVEKIELPIMDVPKEPLPEKSIIDRPKDVAVSGAVGAGVYGAQKGAESLVGKMKLMENFKKASDPDMLAYKGIGGDLVEKQKALPTKMKKQIGKTARTEGLANVFKSAEDNYDKVKHQLNTVGKEIADEAKKTEKIIASKNPLIRRKMAVAMGGEVAREYRELANGLSDHVPAEVNQKQKLLKQAKRMEKGLTFSELQKAYDGFAKEAKYKDIGGAPKNPLAATQREILQKIRVNTVKTILEDTQNPTSRIESLNTRYHNLKNSKDIIKKLRDKTAGTSSSLNVIKKGARVGIGGAIGGPAGAVAGLASDSQIQRAAARVGAKFQEAKIGKLLKTVGGTAKFGGKLLWKSLPVIAALTTYSEARANGVDEKQAATAAGLDALVLSTPVIGQVRLAIDPSTAGPKKGTISNSLEQGDISPTSKIKRLIEGSVDDIKSVINKLQENDNEVSNKYLKVLVGSLDKSKRTRISNMFGLLQNPEFRKLINIKKEEK